MSAQSPPTELRSLGWSIALVVLAAVVVFAPALRNDFVFDDVAQVRDLSPAAGFADWIASAADPWWPAEKVKFVWRPLTRMFILAQKAIFPSTNSADSALPFHTVSIALHAIVSALALILCVQLGANRRIALIAALALAVHPLRSEAVHQIVGQAELLAAILMLIGLIVHASRANSSPNFSDFVFQSVIFSLALSAKEHAILYPAYLLLLMRDKPPRRMLLPLGALGLIAIAFVALRAGVTGGLIEPRNSVPAYENLLADHGFLARVPAAFGLYGYFITQLLVPLNLAPDFSAQSLPVERGWGWSLAWLGLAGVVVMLSLIRHNRSRGGTMWRFMLAFLIAYGFIANFFFTHGVIFALRLLYWPCIVLAIAFTLASSRIVDRIRFSERTIRWSGIAAFCVIVLWASASWRFAPAWRNELELAAATAEQFPKSWRAHHNLAREYYLIKNFEPGYKHACVATTLRPEDGRSWDFRGLNAMFLPERARDAEASFLQAIKADPSLSLPYQHLGNLMRMQGREAEASSYDAKYRAMIAEVQTSADDPEDR